MDQPLLIDRSHAPSDAELEELLGRSKRHWDELIRQATETDAASHAEWRFYSKKSGWVLVVRGKKRNVLYMRPIDRRRFLVTFAFADEHVEAVERSRLPRGLVSEIRNARKYAEGRMARVDVTTAAEFRLARTLLQIKQSE